MPVNAKHRILWTAAWATLLTAGLAHGQQQDELLAMTLEQRLGEWAPLDAEFTDSQGQPVRLGDYFGETPVVLMMGYYECPNLCTLVLNGASNALTALTMRPARDYQLVFVSIDPSESSALAAANKRTYTRYYGKAGATEGWHFLTGDSANIQRLASAIGFNYEYDAGSGQYAHPSGLIVATPEGQLSRYFYGIEFEPRDLRLAMVEASEGKMGDLTDQLLLLCFHYNPETGKYGLLIHRVMQLAGAGTVLLLGGVLGTWIWRERAANGKGEAD